MLKQNGGQTKGKTSMSRRRHDMRSSAALNAQAQAHRETEQTQGNKTNAESCNVQDHGDTKEEGNVRSGRINLTCTLTCIRCSLINAPLVFFPFFDEAKLERAEDVEDVEEVEEVEEEDDEDESAG